MANILKATYVAAVKGIAPTVTSFNPCDFEIHDIDIACAADAGPTQAEIFNTFNNTIIPTRLNQVLGLNVALMVDADFPAGGVTGNNIRTFINNFIRNFNRDAPAFNIQLSSVNTNEGFNRRKNLLFNSCGNIMAAADAGRFKLRIPLDHLFNFCKFYRNGIYNARHELRFTRQSDDMAVYRYRAGTEAAKIRLDKIKWMMPRVVLNPETELRVKEDILKQDVYVPVAFIGKYFVNILL